MDVVFKKTYFNPPHNKPSLNHPIDDLNMLGTFPADRGF